MIYSNTCSACKASGRISQYIGETSRSGAERLRNHWADSRSKKADQISHMEIHRLAVHPEDVEPPSWEFKVERRAKSCFYRQIGECVLIRKRQQEGILVLNKKEEYSISILPQLEVSIGGRILVRRTAENIREQAVLENKEVKNSDVNNIVKFGKRKGEEK